MAELRIAVEAWLETARARGLRSRYHAFGLSSRRLSKPPGVGLSFPATAASSSKPHEKAPPCGGALRQTWNAV